MKENLLKLKLKILACLTALSIAILSLFGSCSMVLAEEETVDYTTTYLYQVLIDNNYSSEVALSTCESLFESSLEFNSYYVFVSNGTGYYSYDYPVIITSPIDLFIDNIWSTDPYTYVRFYALDRSQYAAGNFSLGRFYYHKDYEAYTSEVIEWSGYNDDSYLTEDHVSAYITAMLPYATDYQFVYSSNATYDFLYNPESFALYDYDTSNVFSLDNYPINSSFYNRSKVLGCLAEYYYNDYFGVTDTEGYNSLIRRVAFSYKDGDTSTASSYSYISWPGYGSNFYYNANEVPSVTLESLGLSRDTLDADLSTHYHNESIKGKGSGEVEESTYNSSLNSVNCRAVFYFETDDDGNDNPYLSYSLYGKTGAYSIYSDEGSSYADLLCYVEITGSGITDSVDVKSSMFKASTINDSDWSVDGITAWSKPSRPGVYYLNLAFNSTNYSALLSEANYNNPLTNSLLTYHLWVCPVDSDGNYGDWNDITYKFDSKDKSTGTYTNTNYLGDYSDPWSISEDAATSLSNAGTSSDGEYTLTKDADGLDIVSDTAITTTYDNATLYSNIQSLLTIISSVPKIFSILFGFFPDWLLNTISVCIGIIVTAFTFKALVEILT